MDEDPAEEATFVGAAGGIESPPCPGPPPEKCVVNAFILIFATLLKSAFG